MIFFKKVSKIQKKNQNLKKLNQNLILNSTFKIQKKIKIKIFEPIALLNFEQILGNSKGHMHGKFLEPYTHTTTSASSSLAGVLINALSL
jgi:hypothetical protein